MRIKNYNLSEPNVEIIPIIRGDQDIIIKACCVRNFDELEKVCPQPKPPYIKHRNQNKAVPNVEDPKYKKELQAFAENRTNWMIIKSLEATDDLEWDTVDLTDPSTWGNFKDELEAANFGQAEIVRIINGVLTANGLDDERVEEAKKRFLAGEQAQEKQISQKEELLNT